MPITWFQTGSMDSGDEFVFAFRVKWPNESTSMWQTEPTRNHFKAKLGLFVLFQFLHSLKLNWFICFNYSFISSSSSSFICWISSSISSFIYWISLSISSFIYLNSSFISSFSSCFQELIQNATIKKIALVIIDKLISSLFTQPIF